MVDVMPSLPPREPLCYGRWLDKGEPVCQPHGYLWPDGEKFCNAIEDDVREALNVRDALIDALTNTQKDTQ